MVPADRVRLVWPELSPSGAFEIDDSWENLDPMVTSKAFSFTCRCEKPFIFFLNDIIVLLTY